MHNMRRVKHWHKWTLLYTYDKHGRLFGDARQCECGARKRISTKNTRFIAEFARPDQDFEPIATGSGPNMQMLKARADGRRYDAIALLAWRQHECGYGTVEECAKRLGWNLGYKLLMTTKPQTIELSDEDQTYFAMSSALPADPGPYR